MTELLSMDQPRKHIAGMISGLDICYDLADDDPDRHPLIGRRMPDLDLSTTDGPTCVFNLLHHARPVLLNLGKPGSIDITPWSDRVRMIDATCTDRLELPVLGEVPAPAAVLIRPDGYAAWTGDVAEPGLSDALTTWIGTPTAV
jgi:3-(3-hydroxy-phenyl)propionate hydroxylase